MPYPVPSKAPYHIPWIVALWADDDCHGWAAWCPACHDRRWFARKEEATAYAVLGHLCPGTQER